MADQVTTKTFILMNQSVEKNSIFSLKNNNGFSLMEITVVILIIGGLLSIALPRMSIKKQDTKKVLRDISQSVKEIRNRAKLYNTSYRLAIKLDKDEQSYWVEKSNTVTYIDKKALDLQREMAKSAFAKDKADDQPSTPTGFQPDPTFFKKEQTLPKDFTFKLVESGSRNDTFTDGIAYIHFFPQGFLEPSIIQVEDPKKNIWTIFFNSLTGASTLIPEARALKDIER